MTKQFILPFMVLLCTSFFALGQTCVPDTTIPDTIPVVPLPFTLDTPLEGIADTACANTYFETVFQINLPESIDILGSVQTLTSATIATEGAVNNLPASLSYVCNPPDCVFLTDTVGCIVLYGTPTADEIGEHDITIETTLLIGGIIPVVRTLPDPLLAPGNYYLNVHAEGSANCWTTGVSEVIENGFDLRIQPNPLSDYAEIFVNLPNADDYTFTVYSSLGTAVKQQKMNLQSGENYIHFDGSDLPTGMYVFTLNNEKEASSGRLLIQR